MKLSEIDPEATRDEVLTAILSHLQSYAVPLMALGGDPRGVTVPSLDEARTTTLGFEIRACAHYARAGRWILDGEAETAADHHALAWDALTQVVCALYASPMGEVPVPLDADADPDTAWGVVLLACVGRQHLAQGEAITAVHLAILGGVTRARIHQLVDARELDRAKHGGVAPESARRWLSARGVEA